MGRAVHLITPLAVLAIFLSPALATADSGLVFLDNTPLAMSWAQGEAGQTRVLCNAARLSATNVTLATSGFGFTRNGKPAAEADVSATATAVRDSLGSGQCTDVTLRVQGHPDGGSYAGALTVVASGSDGLARLPVTITGPDPQPVAATGAVATTPLKAERAHPFAPDASLSKPGELALTPAAAGQQLGVPASCPPRADLERLVAAEQQARAVDEQARLLDPANRVQDGDTVHRAQAARLAEEKKRKASCPFLGNIYNGADFASVYVDGPLRLRQGGPALLPIRLTGAGEIGDYAGSLDLAQTPKSAKDDVAVKVSVTDSVWWAIAALLAGAALFVLTQLALRRYWPRQQLVARLDAFQTAYAAAEAAFPPDSLRVPSPEDISKHSKAIRRGIRRYGQSTVWFDSGTDAFKQLDAAIDEVERDIATWRDKQGLARAVQGLHASLAHLATFLNSSGVSAAPPLALPAGGLLNPRQLKVGEANQLVASADACSMLIAEWLERAKTLEHYSRWLAELEDTPMPAPKVAQRQLAKTRLDEASWQLLEVSGPDDLEWREAARNQRAAYRLLAELGAEYGWLPTPAPVTEGMVGVIAFDWIPDAMLEVVAGWISDAFVDAKSAVAPHLKESVHWVIGAAIVCFSIVVGIATGLAAFYFGGPWGTTEDYITVVIVGVAAQGLVQGVVDTVSRLLSPVPDQLIAGAAPATLVTRTAGGPVPVSPA